MYDWLNERLLIASEETYRDLSNIQGKVMKHRTFEAEIQANKERLDNICEVSVKITENDLVQHNEQYQRKVQPSSYHLNGHTIGFHPQTQIYISLDFLCVRSFTQEPLKSGYCP